MIGRDVSRWLSLARLEAPPGTAHARERGWFWPLPPYAFLKGDRMPMPPDKALRTLPFSRNQRSWDTLAPPSLPL